MNKVRVVTPSCHACRHIVYDLRDPYGIGAVDRQGLRCSAPSLDDESKERYLSDGGEACPAWEVVVIKQAWCVWCRSSIRQVPLDCVFDVEDGFACSGDCRDRWLAKRKKEMGKEEGA